MKDVIHSHLCGITISISYCQNVICCAVANFQIGVDVLNTIEFSQNQLISALTNEEVKIINGTCHDIKEATRLITLKECYGKYMMVGLGYSLNITTLYHSDNIFTKDGVYFESIMTDEYVLSYCCAEGYRLNRVNIEPQDIYLCMHAFERQIKQMNEGGELYGAV